VDNALETLAQGYRLKLRRDYYGQPFIQGQRGEILVGGPGHFPNGYLILWIRRKTFRQMVNAARRLSLAGCRRVVEHPCDIELFFYFDWVNGHQAELAIKEAGIRPRRMPRRKAGAR
jgi:hypothetical protein